MRLVAVSDFGCVPMTVLLRMRGFWHMAAPLYNSA